MWTPNAAATATSTASKMNIISASGTEPAADFRRALGERRRDSALPLVVWTVSARPQAGRACAMPSPSGGRALPPSDRPDLWCRTTRDAFTVAGPVAMTRTGPPVVTEQVSGLVLRLPRRWRIARLGRD